MKVKSLSPRDPVDCSLVPKGFMFLVAKNELPRWLSGKESTRQCKSLRFNLWVGKVAWRKKWQPAPVFWEILAWEIPCSEELGGLQSIWSQSDTAE